jgi:hypothetical protein
MEHYNTGNWQLATVSYVPHLLTSMPTGTCQASRTKTLVGLALYAAAAGANAPPPTVTGCVVEALGYLLPSYIQSGGWWALLLLLLLSRNAVLA